MKPSTDRSHRNRPGLFSRLNYLLFWWVADGFTLAALFAAFHAYRQGGVPSFWPLEAFLISYCFCAAALYVAGGYSSRTGKLSLEYSTIHLSSLFLALPLILCVVYVFTAYADTFKPSRGALIPAIATFAPLSLVFRRLIEQRVRGTYQPPPIAILGATDDLRSLWHELFEREREEGGKYRFFSLDGAPMGPLTGPESPRVEAWNSVLLESRGRDFASIVLASPAAVLPAPLRRALSQAHLDGLRVYSAEAFAESVFGKVLLREVDDEWILDREINLAQSASYFRLKKIIDRILATGLLLLFLPVILLVSLLILVLDGRPVFYLQNRYGLRGGVFALYKFRTMRQRPKEGSLYTSEGDERLTVLGKILRPFRLDELPQLWNVLAGDMSLIGPRAEWVRCVERYEEEIPYYHLRHEVPPGLTGWAQVNFPYGSGVEDAREKLRYDLYYIRNHSFLMDFQIVLKTVYVVLTKAGGK